MAKKFSITPGYLRVVIDEEPKEVTVYQCTECGKQDTESHLVCAKCGNGEFTSETDTQTQSIVRQVKKGEEESTDSVFLLGPVPLSYAMKFARRNEDERWDLLPTLASSCIKGWETVKTPEGEAIPFKEEYVEFLPQMDQLALVMFMVNRTISKGTDRKKVQS